MPDAQHEGEPPGEAAAALAALEKQINHPDSDGAEAVAKLNGVLGEVLYVQARSQKAAERRRLEHAAVARFRRSAQARSPADPLRVSALRYAADIAKDLSGGCADELRFALEVQAQYAQELESSGADRATTAVALVQTAEYQYFRSLFEDVLTTLQRVDVDALDDPGLRSTVPSLRGSALKQLERYPEALDDLQAVAEALEPGDAAAKQVHTHLAETLQRMGRREEAEALFQTGVERGYYMSAIQRPGEIYQRELVSRPIWDVRDASDDANAALLSVVSALEQERVWTAMRGEARAAISDGKFVKDPGQITRYAGGPWYHLVLYEYGLKDFANCALVPQTCAAVERLAQGNVARMARGQVKLSLMAPGIHVLPHCGPTNARIRMHLGLQVPEGITFKVGGEDAAWQEGKVLVFDDSFEHEIDFPSSGDGGEAEPTAEDLLDTGRLVLLFDVFHPSLTASEIAEERPAKPPERVIANNLKLYRELAENYGIGQEWATQ